MLDMALILLEHIADIIPVGWILVHRHYGVGVPFDKLSVKSLSRRDPGYTLLDDDRGLYEVRHRDSLCVFGQLDGLCPYFAPLRTVAALPCQRDSRRIGLTYIMYGL